MRTIREWWHRLIGSLRPWRGDTDLEDELRAHMELAADDANRGGAAPDEVMRRVRLKSGGALQALEALRDQRGVSWLETLRRDVGYGLRTLRRSPSFTIVALVTLALGIGANAAIYQLLDAVRLRALPIREPGELVVLDLADGSRFSGRRTSGHPVLSNPVWELLRDRQEIFSGVLAWASVDLRLDRPVGPSVARGVLVSGDFFSTLGVAAHLGRTFSEGDDRPGCGVPGTVVSYRFWQQYLGADPAAIGRTLSLNGRAVDVIGVAAPGFSGVEVGRSFDVAVPICAQASLGGEPDWLTSGSVWWLTVMARVSSERSLSEVNQQLDVLSRGLFDATVPPGSPPEFASNYAAARLRAVPASTGVSALRRRYADPLLILQLTTGLVLFVACTNLANLVLARATAREREFALRLAVGGSWGRLVRQLMVENGLIAVGGAASGLVCAAALSRVLVGLLGADLNLDVRFDVRLLAVMLGLAALTCLTFGLIPAWRASRVAAVDAMKANMRSGAGTQEGTGLRRALVVVQVACSLVLLFGGLLFTGTLRNLMTVDMGFRSEGVTIARVDLSRMTLSPELRTSTIAAVLASVRQLPEVTSAAEVRHVPLGGTGSTMFVVNDSPNGTSKIPVRFNATSADYLKTMGVTLVAGRDFEPRDTSTAPKVAIVNRTFVRQLGLGDNPVGRTFRGQTSPTATSLYQIIGLTPDTKFFSLREEALPIVLLPITQIADPRPFTEIMVRSTLPSAQVAASVSRAVSTVSTSIDAESRAFDTTLRAGLMSERFMAILSGLFGVLATLIAAVGLYGLMSYLVLRRTNEIGVRMTLGASRGSVIAIVLREAVSLLTAGLAIGAVVSMAAAGSVRSLVFGLEPRGLGIIGIACVVLALTGVAASYLPARRAANLPPLLALRED